MPPSATRSPPGTVGTSEVADDTLAAADLARLGRGFRAGRQLGRRRGDQDHAVGSPSPREVDHRGRRRGWQLLRRGHHRRLAFRRRSGRDSSAPKSSPATRSTPGRSRRCVDAARSPPPQSVRASSAPMPPARRIAAGAVGASEVAGNTLTAPDLAADSVGASELANDSVDAAAIQTDAVGRPRSPTRRHLDGHSRRDDRRHGHRHQTRSTTTSSPSTPWARARSCRRMGPRGRRRPLTATDLAADSVGASELANNPIDTAAIAADAVTSAKVATDTLAAADLAADSVADIRARRRRRRHAPRSPTDAHRRGTNSPPTRSALSSSRDQRGQLLRASQTDAVTSAKITAGRIRRSDMRPTDRNHGLDRPAERLLERPAPSSTPPSRDRLRRLVILNSPASLKCGLRSPTDRAGHRRTRFGFASATSTALPIDGTTRTPQLPRHPLVERTRHAGFCARA